MVLMVHLYNLDARVHDHGCPLLPSRRSVCEAVCTDESCPYGGFFLCSAMVPEYTSNTKLKSLLGVTLKSRQHCFSCSDNAIRQACRKTRIIHQFGLIIIIIGNDANPPIL